MAGILCLHICHNLYTCLVCSLGIKFCVNTLFIICIVKLSMGPRLVHHYCFYSWRFNNEVMKTFIEYIPGVSIFT